VLQHLTVHGLATAGESTLADYVLSPIAHTNAGLAYGGNALPWMGGVRLEPLANLAHELRTPLQVIRRAICRRNAVKFTSAGSVSIAVRRCHRNGEDCIEFEVKDTGPGIPADQMKTAFEPFSQGSNSSTRKNRGLGVGLALVQHHVESLGASLDVTSDPNGSSFIVRITAKKSAGTAAA